MFSLLLTYLKPYCPAGGLRLSTNLSQGVLACAKVSILSQVLPITANSEVSLHLQVCLGAPDCLEPCRSQVKACLCTLNVGRCRVCSIQLYFLFKIWALTGGLICKVLQINTCDNLRPNYLQDSPKAVEYYNFWLKFLSETSAFRSIEQ